MSKCNICYETATTEHFNLYVFGSEGLNVCHKCRIELCTYILELAMSKMRNRRDNFKEKKNSKS